MRKGARRAVRKLTRNGPAPRMGLATGTSRGEEHDRVTASVQATAPLLRYRVPAGEAQSELVIKNSRFIASAGPASDVAAAQAFVARIRAAYPDAHHHAWAFRIGVGSHAQSGSSDDGEPGGTAGRPMLAVLEGSGLSDVVVVGTRYFGGIKLGPGGLVRAYSGAARQALQALPTVVCVLHRLARLSLDYGLYGLVQRLLPRYWARVHEVHFAEQVTAVVAVPYERAPALEAALQALTNGQLNLLDHTVQECYLRSDSEG